ncbi:hypothetical protein [Amnibacterium sp.]|uniref:hypothetical protein n=1 Tax=Amnibacterium sp. TaxID=1872496 RepID=UPI003F7BF7CB
MTLFALTNELLAAARSPDELLRDVLGSGVTGVVEIDAAQHFRSFPRLEPAEVARTAGVVRDEGGAVSLLGGGADLTPAPGRTIDEEAALAQLRAQLDAAAVLGAVGVRVPFGVLPWSVLERAAQHADGTGVLLLEEVQGPEDPGGPRLLARVDDLQRSGVTGVRLLLDTSALMAGAPPGYLRALEVRGLPTSVVAGIAGAFRDGSLAARVLPLLADPSSSPEVHGLLVTALTRFGSTPAAAWLPLVPWIASVHLTWWDLESAEADLDGEVGAVLDSLFAAGFAGVVCSEWGGHEWEPASVSGLDRTRAHRRLVETRFRDASIDFGMKTT